MKKNKLLCIDINSIVPLFVRGHLNGIGRTTLELVEALADIKDEIPFDITLYSQNMKGIGGQNLNLPFKNKHLYYPHREKYNKVFQYFPIKDIITGSDLMHIPHNFEYVFNPKKTIVTLHDTLFMKIQEKAFEHWKLKEVIPPFIRQSKAVITCSENSKKDIVETMLVDPGKIHVIPWGVRHDVFYPEPDLKKIKQILASKWNIQSPYFFSVSCNDERKNTHILIDSYICLASKSTKNDLCLVWDAPEYIRKRVAESGLQHRIHFLTKIDDNDLRLLYSGATVTVFPSLYEGFGLPVLESMACGTPVISSNTSSLPEVGGDAAYYIDPYQESSILEALEYFDDESFKRTSWIEKSVNQASKFTWKKCALETLKIYEKYLLAE